MQKVKQFFANNKFARVTCVVLAVALVFGALGAFSSLFHRDKIKEGVQYPADHSNTEAYGRRSSDYAVLYDQEGLVACYVAYGSDSITEKGDNSLSWKNHVSGGKDATLYGAHYWRRYNGGIGYTMSITQWEADKEKVGCNVPYMLSTDETDEYVVETVLAYTGVTNADGSLYQAASVDYPKGVNNMAKSAFRFGIIHSLGYVSGHSENSDLAMRNRWFFSNISPKDCYTAATQNEANYYKVLGDDFFAKKHVGKISLMTLSMKAESTNFLVEASLAYGNYLRRTDLMISIPEDVSLEISQKRYTDSAERFSLFNGFPGVLYSVRYYDRAISQETRLRNFFVDLCGFYDVNVSSFFKLSTDELKDFLVRCGTAADLLNVEMDAKAVSTNRALVYQIINDNLKG